MKELIIKNKTFIKYCIFGLITTILHILLFIILDSFLKYYIANIITLIIVKIVAYTRNSDDRKESAVDRYNRLIREKLYPGATTSTFEKGDLIIFNETYGNEISSVPNSFESSVERIRPCESSLPQFEGLELEEVERVYVTFDTPYGHMEVPALVPTLANKLKHQRNINKIAKYCEKNRRSWPRYYDYKQTYAADISYAYAIGDHKSQGSTYEVVAVDVAVFVDKI